MAKKKDGPATTTLHVRAGITAISGEDFHYEPDADGLIYVLPEHVDAVQRTGFADGLGGEE